MLKQGAPPYYNIYGYTPLHAAAQACDLDGVRALIDQGWDINALSEMGETPLHAFVWGAARMDEVTGHVHEMERAMVRLLLDLGANPDLPCGSGMTAKDAAKFNARSDLCELIEAYKQRGVIWTEIGSVPDISPPKRKM